MKNVISRYYTLTKPGIIYGNLLSTLSGILLAGFSSGIGSWYAVAGVIFGTATIIGGSCVLNNVIDRDIDKKMKRTKKRAIVVGDISIRSAVIYGIFLNFIGFTVLYLTTNLITILVGLLGVVMYVGAYGLAKRRTPWSTEIGSVAGAIPPLAGYTAVVGLIDPAGLLLFAILTFWQMPHFFAISLFRKDEYRSAHLPLLSIVKGEKTTQRRMQLYLALLAVSALLLPLTDTVSLFFALSFGGICLFWSLSAQNMLGKMPVVAWARKQFFYSLIVLLLLPLLLLGDGLLRLLLA